MDVALIEPAAPIPTTAPAVDPPPPPRMLFPEHHWKDYPAALKDEIQRILLPPSTLIAPLTQVAQTALVVAQPIMQPQVPLLPPIIS
uniref:Uncharacterized protein n=1 Tax=Romanomermis culicivorax TaxID=13658 RepID=A0A915JCN7_ROMCU